MYGPAYLVSPVTRPMEYGPESTPLHEEKTVSVYLPAGADWYGEDNEIFYEGGQDVTVEAGVDTMPVFVRAGSVIPKASEADAVWQIAARLYLPARKTECSRFSDIYDSHLHEVLHFPRVSLSFLPLFSSSLF